MAQAPETLRSVLIPLERTQIVLPNAAVAEVTAYVQPEPVEGTEDWLLGMVTWRGVRIPMVSYEALLGDQVPSDRRGVRMAVFYALSPNRKVDFIAVRVAEIPRLIRLDEDSLHAAPSADEAATGVLRSVEIYGDTGLIPDLDGLEAAVARQLTQAGVEV